MFHILCQYGVSILFLIVGPQKHTLNSYDLFWRILVGLYGRHIWIPVCVFISCYKITLRAYMSFYLHSKIDDWSGVILHNT
jgi:hypothetical protein